MSNCDICDAPATISVQDLRETFDSTIYETFVPIGDPRHGCDEHWIDNRWYPMSDEDQKKYEAWISERINDRRNPA